MEARSPFNLSKNDWSRRCTLRWAGHILQINNHLKNSFDWSSCNSLVQIDDDGLKHKPATNPGWDWIGCNPDSSFSFYTFGKASCFGASNLSQSSTWNRPVRSAVEAKQAYGSWFVCLCPNIYSRSEKSKRAIALNAIVTARSNSASTTQAQMLRKFDKVHIGSLDAMDCSPSITVTSLLTWPTHLNRSSIGALEVCSYIFLWVKSFSFRKNSYLPNLS